MRSISMIGQQNTNLVLNNKSMLEFKEKIMGDNAMFLSKLTQRQEEVLLKVFGSDKSKTSMDKKQEAYEDAEVFFELVKSAQGDGLILKAKDLEEEAIKRIKGQFATKDFVGKEIAELRTELKGDISKVRNEIAELRTELKGDISELRTELKDDISKVRGEISKVNNRLWILVVLVVMLSPQAAELLSKIFSFIK